ncbi:MAG: hypothetical protein SF069_06145 [Phycisphaerae bacterium]|nr:hypothetical protein [Phycisphaerae bacterium]
MSSASHPSRGRAFVSPAALPALLVVAAAILLSGTRSSVTPLVLFEDGLRVAGLLLAAAGFGAWPTAWLLPGRVGGTRAFLLSTALGSGLLVALVLLLGCTGLLSGGSAWILVIAGIVLGLSKLLSAAPPPAELADPPQEESAGLKRVGFVWLETALLAILAWPLSIAIFGATLPPGLIWPEEGNGYDVLEYHLQAPREYFDAGRIQFLPHNVYAQFPQQVELLYLLLMHLRGNAHEAAISAQLLHLALGVLSVVAIGAWLPRGPARWVGVLAAGGVPWLPYLGCLAYNELGVLYFATLAVALVLQALAERDPAAQRRWLIFAGLLGGLATGAKLTAAGVVVAPLALAWLFTARTALAPRAGQAAVLALAAILAFAPWMVRSYSFTGNPVYPFAYDIFGGRDWSAEQAAQWDRGHALPIVDQPPGPRLALAWREALASSMFGPAAFALAVVGAALRRDRVAALLLIFVIAALVAWMTLTHMPGRFLAPLVGVLALLAGRAADGVSAKQRCIAVAMIVLALGGAVASAVAITQRIDKAAADYRARTNVSLADMVDRADILIDFAQPLNHVLEDQPGRLLLIGDAAPFYITAPHRYTVVFNRDPWLEFSKNAAAVESIDWLRSNGFSHVVFCWPEIDRLAGTYGFAAHVTRAWLQSLVAAGLQPAGPLGDDAASERYDIYRVPQTPSSRGAASP